jgi:hypothetical protein
MNGLIHQARDNAEDESDLMKRLEDSLEHLVSLTHPKKLLVLAIDGSRYFFLSDPDWNHFSKLNLTFDL